MKKLNKIESLKDLNELENLIIEFDPQEEDMQPSDSFEDDDAKMVCDKYEQLGLCAWFCAKVTVKYKGFESNDYLGGCSYDSFKQFTTTDKDYYQDMINTCIDSINKEIEHANVDIQKWWNIRKAKNLLRPYGLKVVSSLQLHEI